MRNPLSPTGNSPVQLHKDHLRGVVENWYNLSMALKADPEAEKAFGWILDMYAFSIASAQSEGGPIQYELHRELMAQPPFDPWLTIEVTAPPPRTRKVGILGGSLHGKATPLTPTSSCAS